MVTIAEKYEAERTQNNGTELKVNVFRGGTMPQIQTAGSACFDIHADMMIITGYDEHNNPILKEFPKTLVNGKGIKINTGLKFHIPHGYKLEVYPRSGLALKHGIMLSNCTAQIDSDYTGELQVLMFKAHGGNCKSNCIEVKHGDRIAQAALVPVVNTQLVQTDEEPQETERGSGSFGSTGV